MIARQFVECLEKVKCLRRHINIVIQITKEGIAYSHFIKPNVFQLLFKPFSLKLKIKNVLVYISTESLTYSKNSCVA